MISPLPSIALVHLLTIFSPLATSIQEEVGGILNGVTDEAYKTFDNFNLPHCIQIWVQKFVSINTDRKREARNQKLYLDVDCGCCEIFIV